LKPESVGRSHAAPRKKELQMMSKKFREALAKKQSVATARRSKFVQLVNDDEGVIFALAEDGSVWVYEGTEDAVYEDDTKVPTGWTRLRFDTKRN
jgi:hypothetical protein